MNNFFLGNKFIDRILSNRLRLQEDEKNAWRIYLKHVVSVDNTSEGGFYNIFQWPLQPVRSIEEIIKSIKPKIKIDILFGDSDWMQKDGAARLAK